jgi:hypothetical protein
LGDDENDRSVFKLLANLDLPHFSVGVRSDESPRRLFAQCNLVVDGPTEAVGFLSRLAEWAGSPKSLPGRAAAGRSSD